MKNNNIVTAASIMGAACILASLVFSIALYSSRNTTASLTVTGSAKREVNADHVKVVFNVSRTVIESEIKTGNTQVAKDIELVKTFLKQQQVQDTELALRPISMYEEYRNDFNQEKRYKLTQTIEYSSDDVAKGTKIAKDANSLISQGVFIEVYSPEYTYSKLADLRVELLGDAMKDAENRAKQIAEHGGGKIGNLTSASSGVVQVLAPHSVSVDDYGAYDTQSEKKEVMVTVRASFQIK